MTGQERDLMLAEWIREGHDQGSPDALARALSATRAVRQRPGWTFWRNWLPRPTADLHIWLPRPSVGVLLLVALVVLLALLAVYVGSSPPPPRMPSSIGPAANTLIAFSEDGAISVARLDGSNRRVLSGGLANARHPLFSPDGIHVAFLSSDTADGTGSLFVVPVDGSDPAIEVSQGLDVLGGDVPQYSWSPGSSRIAFSADDGGVSTIYLAASDGGGAVPFTDGTIDSDLPAWSLDVEGFDGPNIRGEWIAYRTTADDGLRSNQVMTPLDGGETAAVTAVIAEDAILSRMHWATTYPVFTGAADADLLRGHVSYGFNPGFGAVTSAVLDFGATHIATIWAAGLGGIAEYGIPWSPVGPVVVLTATDGVIVVADQRKEPFWDDEPRRLGEVADCWVDWSPDGTALFGGSPDGCDRLVVIPLDDLEAATTLPWSISGTADWQPLPE